MELRYFSWIREGIGSAEETLKKPEDVISVTDLLNHLCDRGEPYKTVLKERVFVRVAVNQTHVPHDHAVSNDDEIAIFPPVTGG